jgi:hypothetical protein
MVVAGILSDTQEMLAMGAGPRAVEYVRKQMNIAKFILSEMILDPNRILDLISEDRLKSLMMKLNLQSL